MSGKRHASVRSGAKNGKGQVKVISNAWRFSNSSNGPITRRLITSEDLERLEAGFATKYGARYGALVYNRFLNPTKRPKKRRSQFRR